MANDPNLKGQLNSTVGNCQTCKLYKKPPTKPVVRLQLATRSQETVAMDLKAYQGKITLHVIQLSAAAEVPSKHPKSILKVIFSNWISVYCSAEKFLSENGGEFINEDFLRLYVAFNMMIKTTSAEPPWSNGMVEGYHLVLA